MDRQIIERMRETPRMILLGFENMPPAEQNSMLDYYSRQMDEQSGMLPIYESLISAANSRVVTLEEASALTNDEVILSAIDATRRRGNPAYLPPLDVVVMPDDEPAAKMARLINNGFTKNAILAHESAHKIQFDSSVYQDVMEFLKPNY